MIHLDDPSDGILLGAKADDCRPFVVQPHLYRRRIDFFRGSFEAPQAARKRRFDAKVDLPRGIARTGTWHREHGDRA